MYLTFKAKITTDKKTEAILDNICFSATKLYNTINWHLRNEWQYNRALCAYCDTIGYPHEGIKIPLNRTELQTRFKDNHWAKNMHSQSAQFIVGEVINAYKSWFCHRKNGNKNANPPGFRPKTNLSSVTLMQRASALESKKGNTYLRLSLGTKRTDKLKETTIKITHRKPLPSVDKLKNVRITYDTVSGNYYAHLVFDVEVKTTQQPQLFPTNVVAVDLGVNNIITATFSDGTSCIISGRELKAIRRYWQKVRAKVGKFSSVRAFQGEGVVEQTHRTQPSTTATPADKSPSQNNKGRKCKPQPTTSSYGVLSSTRKPSRRYRKICRKESRQIRHRLHIISKQFVKLCEEKGVTDIVLGNLNGIRNNINYSKRLNQQLHNWNFAQLIDFITYKAQRVGITTELINEKYTSQTCCKCGMVKKSNRKTRGLYVCDCGNKINADRNGANNILTRYLRYRSSGSVALPVVTLALSRTDAHCLRIYSKHLLAS